jgi:hypothetical protein
VDASLKRARALCTYYHKSPKANTAMGHWQVQLKLFDPPHQVVQDVATRWNSTYMMLESLLQLKRAIVTHLVQIEAKVFDDPVTADDWLLWGQLIDILKPHFKVR